MQPNAILRILVNQKKRAEAAELENEKGGIGKRRKIKNNIASTINNLVQRPIIAVCNDVYASSLRSLRPYAEIVSYSRVSPYVIADTLQKICRNEGFDIDDDQLTRIAVDSECDLRSCLNTIQFGCECNNDNKLTSTPKSGSQVTKSSNFQRYGQELVFSHYASVSTATRKWCKTISSNSIASLSSSKLLQNKMNLQLFF